MVPHQKNYDNAGVAMFYSKLQQQSVIKIKHVQVFRAAFLLPLRKTLPKIFIELFKNLLVSRVIDLHR